MQAAEMNESTPPHEPPGTSCPTPFAAAGATRVLMGHGGGGLLSQELIRGVFLDAFRSDAFGPPEAGSSPDAAVLAMPAGRLAFTTDAFVVRPLFFPGGSIGDLAVNGTINDLAMAGAVPSFLAAAFVIEEGLEIEQLARIARSMAAAAAAAGVRIVAGDTKVVERGRGDGVYVTTSGLGIVPDRVQLDPGMIRPGDSVIISGTIGDHGMAVLRVREGIGFEAAIESDTAALHEVVELLLAACPQTRLLRDPTRGGLATCLAEITEQAPWGIEIDEAAVPVAPAVAAACEMLGLDPWLVANEGKLVAIVPAEAESAAVAALHGHRLATAAAVIGRVVEDHPGRVSVRTPIGGRRIVPMPVGELLPRIC
jgi:hydrogenase expression/formation protein HypE